MIRSDAADIPSVTEIVRPLFGLPCWGVVCERFLNLSIFFGAPHLSIREPRPIETDSERLQRLHRYRHAGVRGEWFLWALGADWRLTLPDGRPVTYDSPVKRRSEELGLLNGQKLTSVTVNVRTGTTRFGFDLGAELRLRRLERGDPDHMWLLYEPGGRVLSVRGDGQMTYGPGDEESPPVPIR